ncbi:MAG: hypothetical protein SWY16_26085, partial [Cyanobacteriota bacterium]|nr:hypothetical protein [Cyanobacteriota bacterium]
GNPVKFHQESFENVSRNFSALTYPPQNLKGDRICFIDGQWREVGELPGIPKVASVSASSDKSGNNSIVQKLENLYQKDNVSSSIERSSDWDNSYIVDTQVLIDVLELAERKYGHNFFTATEFHRSISTGQRQLYDGNVNNLKSILSRAVSEELAILETGEEGRTLIRLL